MSRTSSPSGLLPQVRVAEVAHRSAPPSAAVQTLAGADHDLRRRVAGRRRPCSGPGPRTIATSPVAAAGRRRRDRSRRRRAPSRRASAAPRPRCAATTAGPAWSAAGTRRALAVRRAGRRRSPWRDRRRSRMHQRVSAMERLIESAFHAGHDHEHLDHSAAPARPVAGSPSASQARGLPVRVGSRSGDPPFDWDDASDLGDPPSTASAPSTSRSIPTSPCPARPRPSPRFAD